MPQGNLSRTSADRINALNNYRSRINNDTSNLNVQVRLLVDEIIDFLRENRDSITGINLVVVAEEADGLFDPATGTVSSGLTQFATNGQGTRARIIREMRLCANTIESNEQAADDAKDPLAELFKQIGRG